MEAYFIIILIFSILIAILLVGLYFVNNILQYKIVIDNSYLAIRDNLDDSIDNIDNMIDFINANLEHEKSFIKKLKTLKNQLQNITNNKEGSIIYKNIKDEILDFFELENTYKKLVKNKDYLKIKEAVTENRNKIFYAIDIYDKGVINYNNYRENKFIRFLSKLCRIPDYDCYDK